MLDALKEKARCLVAATVAPGTAPTLTGLALAALLAACTPFTSQGRTDIGQNLGAATMRNISTGEIAQLNAQCQSFMPAIEAANAPAAPQPVKDVAQFAQGFCDEMASGKLVDVTQTSNAWLDNVLAMTQEAAQLAGYVLPLVLPKA